MEIEIYSDVVCPWCYIGKRRLEVALAKYDGEVSVRYRPYQLDPGPVPQPRRTLDDLADKFGGPERARQITEHTRGVAAADGLTLNFDRALSANTFEAHRLSWFAAEHGRQPEVMEALHQAHFTDGRDIGARDVLVEVAAEAGLDPVEVREFLDSTNGTGEVEAELAEARRLGVTSVPTFVFAGRYAVSGAQDPATLLEVLAEVGRREGGAAN
ncbi:DsbA family oxidoreductase [Rhizomonospora bruguierae]|uniref:DsbA family oxidoreductase n=1 Tax=Rhizomonospora bruguierae TaxID=1581705 RepID=UPI001BD0ED5C|nr:DsbA family oxidoreductase [Micromonospora sp. NBRC 107566]